MEFNFEQNQVVDTIDKVPAPFNAFYVEAEGKFKIDDKFKDVTKSIDGLNKTAKTLRSGEKTLKEQVAAYKALGDSPEVIQSKIEELNTALSSKEKINPEKIKEEVTKQFKGQLDERDAKLSKKDKAIHKYLVTSQATVAIAEAKGVPELLLPHIERQVKVVEEGEDYKVVIVDAAGDTRYGASGSPLTIAELVASMKSDKVYGRAFESESGGGSGSTNGSQRKVVAHKSDAPISSVDKISQGLAARKNA